MIHTKLGQQMAAALAVIALSILTAPGMNAQCGAGAHTGSTLAPELRSLQEPDALDNKDFSGPASSPEVQDDEKNESKATVLGVWKRLEYVEGVVVDIGFTQYNAGGAELSNDTGPSGGGNNFCMGAWKRIGRRTYEQVHSFFLFDASGKAVAIAIERSSFTVSRDGNTFSGRWAQDSYDFSGNVLPGTHSKGTLTGTRIAPGLPFPFSFPF
jgi:hypothetical protein